ncbi:MAG: hypothetical protein D6780_08160, partial [Candidatus Dadabacteria bacterium]
DIISETLNKAYEKIRQERESLKEGSRDSLSQPNEYGEELNQGEAEHKLAFTLPSLAVINSKLLQSSQVLKITAWIISFFLLLAPFFNF